MNNPEPLPPTILVQQPDGTKAKAVLLRWPVNGLPVYAVEVGPMPSMPNGIEPIRYRCTSDRKALEPETLEPCPHCGKLSTLALHCKAP